MGKDFNLLGIGKITISAIELLQVVNLEPNFEYVWDISKQFSRRYGLCLASEYPAELGV